MSDKLPFADLPPPPGGLVRLRERLDRGRRRLELRWTLWPALGAALLLLVFQVTRPRPALLSRPALSSEPVIALGSSTAVEQLSAGPVLVYRVATLQ